MKVSTVLSIIGFVLLSGETAYRVAKGDAGYAALYGALAAICLVGVIAGAVTDIIDSIKSNGSKT